MCTICVGQVHTINKWMQHAKLYTIAVGRDNEHLDRVYKNKIYIANVFELQP